MKPYQKLQRFWEADTPSVVSARPSEAEVAGLESRYGISVPADFREYLLHCCPIRDVDLSDGTSWWQFDRILNIPDEYRGFPEWCQDWTGIENPAVLTNADKYLFFADFAVWMWAWAIDCGDDENRGRIAAIGTRYDGFVADSFDEFVERSIAGDYLVVGGCSKRRSD